ncbi:transposase [Limobrevibacterium gyesilva]|uniref:transposase n=1 Tax=Limobrevibacterium gyesilva TaxID=2991712 RepID=UPI0038D2244F
MPDKTADGAPRSPTSSRTPGRVGLPSADARSTYRQSGPSETYKARARVVANVSEHEARRVLDETVDPSAHLMRDEWKSFMSIGEAFAARDTVRHSEREYARGAVHSNSTEGFDNRVRRTVAGVFHHISPPHADLYLNEIGFRWSQRVLAGHARRRTRKEREVVKPLWSRITPAL